MPDDDGSAEAALRVVLAQRYRTVRPFLRLLAESVSPDAASGGAAVLAAVKTLAELVARKVKLKPLRPAEIDDRLIPAMWNRAVHANPDLTKGAVDRDAYVLCVLEQLHKALRVRDVFATPSHRWGDPRAQLLDGPGWEAIRPVILDGLGLTGPVQEHLRGLVGRLDAAWVQMADRFAEDTASVRIVPDVGGRMRLSVERLDALEVPSLVELRGLTAAMLPRIDLPELLLEVHAWTGFLHMRSGEGPRTAEQGLHARVGHPQATPCRTASSRIPRPGRRPSRRIASYRHSIFPAGSGPTHSATVGPSNAVTATPCLGLALRWCVFSPARASALL